MPTKMLTLKEWAERHGVKYSTTRFWVGKGWLTGAQKVSFVWIVPATTKPPQRAKGNPGIRTLRHETLAKIETGDTGQGDIE